jgi:hypothetical protein
MIFNSLVLSTTRHRRDHSEQVIAVLDALQVFICRETLVLLVQQIAIACKATAHLVLQTTFQLQNLRNSLIACTYVKMAITSPTLLREHVQFVPRDFTVLLARNMLVLLVTPPTQAQLPSVAALSTAVLTSILQFPKQDKSTTSLSCRIHCLQTPT